LIRIFYKLDNIVSLTESLCSGFSTSANLKLEKMDFFQLATRRMHDACCGWSKLTHFTTDRGINRIYSSEESRHSQSKTSRLFHNMSVRKARNGSTYTCAGYNAHEYGNTPV
jgi:hypothetical protein